MVREYLNKFEEYIPFLPKKITGKNSFKLGLITGKSFFKVLTKYTLPHYEKIKNLETKLLSVENHFYGEEITVAGLLTGQDIVTTITEYKNKYSYIFDLIVLPDNVLNQEGLFLDDYTLDDIVKETNNKVILFSDFASLFQQIKKN